jgi:hypothetical protein
MKRTQFLIVLALFAAAASFVQCGSDSSAPPDPKDEQLKKLTKTWKVCPTPSTCKAVTFNSAPVTGYEGFQITMTSIPGDPNNFNYATIGRPSGIKTPWDASGSFEFGTDFATVLKRDDNILVTYSVTDTQLQMTFTYTGAGYTGRTSNVEGAWTFTFGL